MQRYNKLSGEQNKIIVFLLINSTYPYVVKLIKTK